MPDDCDAVNHEVDRESGSAEHELIGAGQTVWVENRQDVVRDEVPLVTGFAGGAPQTILERRQRADPTRELDERAPDDCRDVKPDDARPTQDQKAAEHDECHK